MVFLRIPLGFLWFPYGFSSFFLPLTVSFPFANPYVFLFWNPYLSYRFPFLDFLSFPFLGFPIFPFKKPNAFKEPQGSPLKSF